MSLLSKDHILGVADVKYALVDVPEWNGQVKVRSLMAFERDAYEASLFTTKTVGDRPEVVSNADNAKARLVVLCAVDDQGNRIFADTDAKALGKKSAAAVDRLFQKIQDLSGLGRRAREAIEGNSGAGRAEDSSSASPAT